MRAHRNTKGRFLVLIIHIALTSFAIANDELINVKVGEVNFKMQRDYLVGGSAVKANVETREAHLSFHYPTMNPGLGDGRDFVLVTIEDVRGVLERLNISREQYLVNEYWEEYLEIDQEVGEVFKIEEGSVKESINRKHYRVKDYGWKFDVEKMIALRREDRGLSKESEGKLRNWYEKHNYKFNQRIKDDKPHHIVHVYTNDDPQKPLDFVVCESRKTSVKAHCNAAFFYRGLFIEIYFNRKELDYFDDMKSKSLGLLAD